MDEEGKSLTEWIAGAETAGGILKMSCPSCGQHFDVTDIPVFSTFVCPVCSAPVVRPLWVDTFRLDEPIEESSGVVTQANAVDLSLERVVTLHFLNPPFAASEERCRQFVDIGRTLGLLNNPSIVTVFNIGVIGAIPFLVTPDLKGKTLQDHLLASEGVVPLETACDWIAAIASGLDAALERGLFHGEINTTNLILDEQTGKPRLIHFGLYELLQDAGYMNVNLFSAPETAEKGIVNEKSDVYSLGALFYYLLTGTDVPSDEENGRRVVHNHWITKMVNDSIADLICRMVSPDPAERPDYPNILATINARLQHIQYVREKLKRIARKKT